MRSLRRVTMVLALLLCATGAEAQSSVKNFLNYCSTGVLRTCASVQLQTETKSGYTFALFRIRNLQGTNPNDNTGGSLITKIGLTHPTIGTVYSMADWVSTEGSARYLERSGENDEDLENAEDAWKLTAGQGIGGPVTFSAGTKEGIHGGIQGCDPSGANPKTYFMTCGEDGWVSFAFYTRTAWSASDADMAFGVQSVRASNQDVSLQCRSELDEGNQHPCLPTTEVVPEPTTMVLLGSGLAGVAYYRRRSRRSDGGPPDDDLPA